MLITVVTVLVIALSTFPFAALAQSPSPQCAGPYQAVFGSTTNCSEAYVAMFSGNSTAEQSMMVCNASEQCNMMIENIIGVCGNMVSLTHRAVINLVTYREYIPPGEGIIASYDVVTYIKLSVASRTHCYGASYYGSG